MVMLAVRSTYFISVAVANTDLSNYSEISEKVESPIYSGKI
jgi:hypothetical protein